MDRLIFTKHPDVVIATNTFVNVPIILQYEDTPLIQVVRSQPMGFTTEIPIYGRDGTYLAKVVGSRLVSTPQGMKAGVTLEHPDKMTVCKLGGQVMFEIVRDEAASLKTRAELYAPDGYFIKCTESPQPELYDTSGGALQVRGVTMVGNRFEGCRIGIRVGKDGSVGICCS